MSTPEIKTPELPVTHTPTDYEPSAMEQGEGIVSTPSQAQATTVQVSDTNQAQVTPIPAPADDTGLQIPADPKVLQKQSHGKADDANTWFAVFWLRAIKRAVKQGLQVFVGGNTHG